MEYFNLETGIYYLRARYYDPALGRFTQADTHWNTANMIYGDNPQTINHRQDALGLTSYTHVPQITAVAQSGNLYVYGISSPVTYIDRSGKTAELALAATTFATPALGAAVFVVGAFIAVVGIIADAASKNSKPVTPVKPTGAVSSPASPPPPNDDDKPTSPKKVSEKWMEKNGLDAHNFKRAVVQQLKKEGYKISSKLSRYDIYHDTATKKIWIKVKSTGQWFATEETWSTLIQYYGSF